MADLTLALLDEVEVIAREAGAAILDVYAGDYGIERKKDDSPVTEADLAAHAIIAARLTGLSPGVPILSEEAADDFHGPDGSGSYWLVDPLDGTKEFINRNGEFTVNIALIEDGRPVLGLVYAPALDVAYSAARGLGAFKATASASRMSIHVAEHAADSIWRVVGSRSHAGDSLAAFLARLAAYELISMGSSLKFCLVAEGRADIYPRLGPTSLWDTAAAQCIVEQAGGRVVQLTGEALSYASPSVLINPFFVVYGAGRIDSSDQQSGPPIGTCTSPTI